MGDFEGVIKAKIVEARFSGSGKVSSVGKHAGDLVEKWGLLASLDRKILQTELDYELNNFEKVRADFEGFAKKYPDPADDNKYTKAEKQASLNASVKQVELAKLKLDACDLFSPVKGMVLSDGGVEVGQNITPSSSAFEIISTDSFYFEFEIDQKDIQDFLNPKKCKIEVEGFGVIEGETKKVYGDGKRFVVDVPIGYSENLLLGMRGKVSI